MRTASGQCAHQNHIRMCSGGDSPHCGYKCADCRHTLSWRKGCNCVLSDVAHPVPSEQLYDLLRAETSTREPTMSVGLPTICDANGQCAHQNLIRMCDGQPSPSNGYKCADCRHIIAWQDGCSCCLTEVAHPVPCQRLNRLLSIETCTCDPILLEQVRLELGVPPNYRLPTLDERKAYLASVATSLPPCLAGGSAADTLLTLKNPPSSTEGRSHKRAATGNHIPVMPAPMVNVLPVVDTDKIQWHMPPPESYQPGMIMLPNPQADAMRPSASRFTSP